MSAVELPQDHPKREYDWADYNIAKLEWLREHKDATGQEIEEACRRIAEEMGL